MPKNKPTKLRLYSYCGSLYLYDGDGWLYIHDKSTGKFHQSWLPQKVVAAMTLVGVNYAPH